MRRLPGRVGIGLFVVMLLSCSCEKTRGKSPTSQNDDSVAIKEEVLVQGISVVDPDDRFNYISSTTVSVAVFLSEGEVVGLDEKSSRIRTMIDDQGKDLRWGRFGPPDISIDQISNDRRGCLMSLRGGGLPWPNSSKVAVTGDLAIKYSVGPTETFKLTNLPLKVETEFNVGSRNGQIKSVMTKSNSLGDKQTELRLLLQFDYSDLKSLRFLNADGHPIKCHYYRRSTVGGDQGRPTETDVDVTLFGTVATATMEFECFKEVKTVLIPFSVATGLDLNAKIRTPASQPWLLHDQ